MPNRPMFNGGPVAPRRPVRSRSNAFSRSGSKLFTVIGSVIAFVVIGFVVAGVFALAKSYNAEHTDICTVSSKESVTKVVDGNSQNEKRVYTEECGVFTVDDSIVKGQWRSADTYGKLKEGHKYAITYNGWRNGFLSSFPNIIKAEEVK